MGEPIVVNINYLFDLILQHSPFTSYQSIWYSNEIKYIKLINKKKKLK